MNKKLIKTIDKIIDFLDKIGIALAIVLIILLLFAAFLYLLRPLLVSAEEVIPKLAVSPGGPINFTAGRPQDWIGQYVKRWFNYIVGGLGIVSVFKVMWGGLKWTTAGGNASQVEAARTTIKNAIMGIVLLLLSFTIFQTINPNLLNLSLPRISKIEDNRVCCQDKTDNTIFEVRLKTCEDNEIDLKDISICDNKTFYQTQKEKKELCPPGASPISIANNNLNQFIILVANNCGVTNPSDPAEFQSKVNTDLTTTVKLKQLESSGEYFGCYACIF